MNAGARLLARAWGKANRRWWNATAVVLAVVLTGALGSVALLAGAQAEANTRVADFYTGDLRITAAQRGAAPAQSFGWHNATELEATRARIEETSGGATVHPRVEATALLSRRSLLEAYISGEQQFGVALPGVASDRDAYLVGVLAGLTASELAAGPGNYLVAGRMPQAGNGTAIEVLLSVQQFRMLLDDDELPRISLPPTTEELAGLRLEVTAAHLDASGRDVLRSPGRVTGLYDSGLDALDQVTFVAAIQDVRRLVGADPDGGHANALTVHGPAPGIRSHARAQGWEVEAAPAFTQRYAGELVAILRVAGFVATAGLAVVPAAMIWLGVSQQLERTRRELAVCRAIGVSTTTLGSALFRVTTSILVRGLAAAAAILLVVGLTKPLWVPIFDAPVPLGLAFPVAAVAIILAMALLATGAALALALSGIRQENVAGALRSL